jgi:hypothetical protein
MSGTTPVGSTGTSGTGATTSGTGATSDPTAFQTALANSVIDARSIATTSLGSMVATAQKASRSPAISKPVAPSTAAGSTNSVSSAGTASTGKKGGVNVPDELRAYGNGKIPADALAPIGIKRHTLWNVAAEAFKEMRAAAAADGVDIGVTDSYRDYDEQVDLVRRKGLYSQGGLAAVPGTSPHGWGMALDVDVTPSGLAWMREHAADYGYVEAVPREPWHWEYHGNK